MSAPASIPSGAVGGGADVGPVATTVSTTAALAGGSRVKTLICGENDGGDTR